MKTEIEVVELTWGRTFKIWWCYFCRAVVFGLIATFVWGLAIGLFGFGARMGYPLPTYISFAGYSSWVVILPTLFIVMRTVLKKKFSDFRIVLVKKDDKPKDEQE